MRFIVLICFVAFCNIVSADDCAIAAFGNSNSNTKTATLPSSIYKCPSKVDKNTPWLAKGRWGDQFDVTQVGNRVTVKRLDYHGGWGQNLQFRCCQVGGGATNGGSGAVSGGNGGAMVNLAKGSKYTSQSTTNHGGLSQRAVDGNHNSRWSSKTITHTHNQNNPWWSVDFKKLVTVFKVKVWNRLDCCSGRLSGAHVYVVNGGNRQLIGTLPNMGGKASFEVKTSGTVGTKVMIQIPGAHKILSLAEVEVWGRAGGRGAVSGGNGGAMVNLAKGSKYTSQSTTNHGGLSSRAVDGNHNSRWSSKSITHTHNQNNPWWIVDFKKLVTVFKVKVWNRLDCCSGRLSGAHVYVINGGNRQLIGTLPNMGGKASFEVKTSGTVGTKVMIQIPGAHKILSLAEVEVWGRAGGSGNAKKCAVASFGNSGSNTKTATLPSSIYKCPSKVDKNTPWLAKGRWGDQFDVTQVGNRVTVKRTDYHGGWGQNLQFKCCTVATPFNICMTKMRRCFNGGTCKPHGASYTCTCKSGFIGKQCKIQGKKECKIPGGKCLCNQVTGKKSNCKCEHGWMLVENGGGCINLVGKDAPAALKVDVPASEKADEAAAPKADEAASQKADEPAPVAPAPKIE